MNAIRPRILVVDDKADNRDILSEHLRRLGFPSDEAENADQVFRMLNEAPLRYGAILLDWMMPGMDGVDVFQRLRNSKVFGHIPMAIITARTDAHSRKCAAEVGVRHFLAKPFGRDELVEVLNQLLGETGHE